MSLKSKGNYMLVFGGALLFGVSYGVVLNIRAGRSWKHVANDNAPKQEAAA